MGTNQEFNFDNHDVDAFAPHGGIYHHGGSFSEGYPPFDGQVHHSVGPDFTSGGHVDAPEFTSHDKSMGKTLFFLTLWLVVPIVVVAAFALVAAVGKAIVGE